MSCWAGRPPSAKCRCAPARRRPARSRALGHNVRELDPAGDSWQLPPETGVVFLALHGTYGEDGGVQARLEELGVPYTGCGPEASRTAFDKVLTKQRCLRRGIPTARFAVLRAPRPDLPPGWTPPVVLKPVRQGSSIGVHIVERAEEWEAALADAFRYDTEVLLEEKIQGRETTVGILEDRALPVAEIRVKNGAFDYRNKYTAGAARHFCPADFDAATTARIQSAALGAFRAIGGRDFARVDVMVHRRGGPGGAGSQHPARPDGVEHHARSRRRRRAELRPTLPAHD